MFAKINRINDVEPYKVLEYENYMPNLKDQNVIRNIAENFQKAIAHDIMFDEDDLQWLYGFAYSRCHTVRHNDNGTVFISGNLQTIYKKFKDKIDNIIPGAENSPVVGGNFFITPSQYGLHNDSTREKDWQDTLKNTPLDSDRRRFVPWRNVIIPIYTCLPGVESHGVFFDQRHIDFAHVYHHGRKPDQKVATTYPLVDDHKDIDFHLLDGTKQDREKNLLPYNENHFDRYLYYTPKRRLTGLTPELTCKWEVGKPIVFDAVQLHATNKGLKDRQWNTKMGLLLTFLREM
tara:strand:+ start:50670 stop:51539 length:870 start_codon:yes stop_codon:yes gene_type:complete